MIKAELFWNYLCNTLDYRFFAGLPCRGLTPLYNKMSSDFLHYIPAVTEQIAVGMVNGATLTGVKSACLLDADKICLLDLSFNVENKVPLLLIAANKDRPALKKDIYVIDLTDNLESTLFIVNGKFEEKNKPVVLFIGEGVLQ